MPASASWYGKGLQHVMSDVNLLTATVKMLLTTSAYTPNQDTHEFLTDITNEVANGNGYTTGGKTVTGLSVAYDTVNNRVSFSFDPVVWSASSFTARIAVLYVSTGVAGTSPLLAWEDAGADQVSLNGTQTVNGDGNFKLRAAAL
jgi:hypothetical protein